MPPASQPLLQGNATEERDGPQEVKKARRSRGRSQYA